jgi:hypothetical protein
MEMTQENMPEVTTEATETPQGTKKKRPSRAGQSLKREHEHQVGTPIFAQKADKVFTESVAEILTNQQQEVEDQQEEKTTTAAAKVAPSRSHIGLGVPESMKEEDRFRVIITGRGQSHGRVSALMRISPLVVAEIKALVDGPLYLTVELALRHYAHTLRMRPPGDIELIKAADLG